MSVEEELQEHTENAKEPFDKRVAATMAILAAFLAVVSVLGHIMTTEELLAQQRASDQWAYYQAKSIRRYQSEVARDLFAGMKLPDPKRAVQKERRKIRKDNEEIQKEAQGLEQESHLAWPAGAGGSISAKSFWSFPSYSASLAIIDQARMCCGMRHRQRRHLARSARPQYQRPLGCWRTPPTLE